MKTFLQRQPRTFLVIASALWFGLYQTLEPLSHVLVDALPVERSSHLYDTLQFFLYDTPKVLLLLVGVVMVMGMVNSWFTPERTRVLLSGRHEGVGNVMAALLGAREKGVEIQLEKVEEIQDVMTYGVMSTPGVVVDGKVVHAGGVPSRDKIAGWL